VVITSGFDLTFALEDPAVPPVDAHATTAAIIRQDDNIAGKRRIGLSPYDAGGFLSIVKPTPGLAKAAALLPATDGGKM
jgi:hypothetical protein